MAHGRKERRRGIGGNRAEQDAASTGHAKPPPESRPPVPREPIVELHRSAAAGGLAMSAWAAGNFDNDTALNRVYALVQRLTGRIDRLLAKPPRRLDRLYDVSEEVMCDVELVELIARHVFEPSTFRWPIGG